MKARENPFASHCIDALPFVFPDQDSWDRLLERIEKSDWRGAIVGPHGTGKTTLLEQLEPLLAERGFVPRRFVLRGESAPGEKQRVLAEVRSMKAPDFLLLDGAEQLTTKQWLPINDAAKACAGCVITLHRASRLPVVFSSEPSPQLLDALVYELCGAWLPPGESEVMFARQRGNIRECLRELYDRWAGD